MHTYRCHPSLRSSRLGPVIGAHSVHLHQSDIDGACGAHCVLMALMILGVLKRSATRDLAHARGQARSLWRIAERRYFIGTGTRDLKSMAAPFRQDVTVKSFRKNMVTKALAVLDESGVAIIGISNESFSHWVLAIGTGGSETGSKNQPVRFLILDPGHPTIPLASWNATLSIKSDMLDRHVYETADGRTLVEVCGLVTLGKVRTSP